jgi:hypothetical protein
MNGLFQDARPEVRRFLVSRGGCIKRRHFESDFDRRAFEFFTGGTRSW